MPEEIDVDCPFCGESISVLIDASVERQIYVEDCEVCCRPIRYEVTCEDGDVTAVRPHRE